MKCILCENKKFKKISSKDARSSEYLLVSMCCNCGLVQQNSIPSHDELKVYYSHNYRKNYKNTYIPKSKHIFRAGNIALQRIQFLNNSNITEGTLLDVGAGGGEFVYLAGKLGFESTGIEPSIGYSEYANYEYGCKVITGELNDIAGTYDIITIFHVFEHLPSPVKAFGKLHSLLNTNGKLFVEVPWIETNDASPHNTYFKAHIFYFTVNTLASCASQYFDVVKVDTSSNLKILLQARMEPTSINFPDTESVNRLRKRLYRKGWLEYLFQGKGLLKPVNKIVRAITESRVKNVKPKKILDRAVEGVNKP
ncbi:MAG: class I SAM-dependent methyltransferase [Gammaproteobacteria bacterium]|nr:class I SAM-dependent methyltransferase [Gammaproteobacteria bacterium]